MHITEIFSLVQYRAQNLPSIFYMYNIKKIGWDSESNIKLERSMSYSYYFCFQDFNDKKKF